MSNKGGTETTNARSVPAVTAFFCATLLFPSFLEAASFLRGSISAAGAVQLAPGIGSISLGAVSPPGAPFIQSKAPPRLLPQEPPEPEPSAELGEAFCFPNPVLPGKKPTIHAEVGFADSVELRFYDDSAALVHEAALSGSPQAVTMSRGAVYAYEYTWQDPPAAGTYVCFLLAKRNGTTITKREIKLAVIR